MVTNPTTEMWEDMRRQGITPVQTKGGGITPVQTKGGRITPGQTRDQLRYVVMIAINSGVLAGIQQTKDNRQNRIRSQFLYMTEYFTYKQNSETFLSKSVGPLTLSLYITDTARYSVV